MKSQPATADRIATNVFDTPVPGAMHREPPPLAAVVDSGLMVLSRRRFQDARNKSFAVVSVSPSFPNQGSGR